MDRPEHRSSDRAIVLLSILLLACLLTCSPTTSIAQTDVIGIFADATHSDCSVVDDGGFLRFWVFHYSAIGATGGRFKAPYQSCLTEYEFVGETHPFVGTVGDSRTGVTISYGACLSGWTHILTIHYFDYVGLGSPVCCVFPLMPHPEATTGEVEVLDCSANWISVESTPAIVQAGPSCPCSVTTGILEPFTTWGAVKALYLHD